MIGLVLAAVIAGPVVQELYTEVAPDSRPASVRRLEDKLTGMRAARTELTEEIEALTDLRMQARTEIESLGTSWDELKGNDTALAKLEVLRRIDERMFRTEGNLAKLETKIAPLEAQLTAANDASLAEAPDPELDALLFEIENAPALEDLPSTEQYQREKELEELFEREF